MTWNDAIAHSLLSVDELSYSFSEALLATTCTLLVDRGGGGGGGGGLLRKKNTRN